MCKHTASKSKYTVCIPRDLRRFYDEIEVWCNLERPHGRNDNWREITDISDVVGAIVKLK